MEQDQQQNWIKWALGAAGLGAIVPFLALKPGRAAPVAIIIIALLVILVGGYLFWIYLARKKAKNRFGALIGEGAKGAPTGLSAQGIAELSALKNKFQEGIQAYKSRGKDLYSLPWFLLVGESSAGKTEAVRHSGVGFPPGLTDCLQGTGGTINMHWWFTNSAVVLDTAGKMMFAGVNPGESSLWQEFLRLLKKARPYCPINGLLLVLPVDSLIKDSANKINEKATLIAKQLDLIQRTLDVRFPVFVLVTKCDLMTGFREFFSSEDDVEVTQQMVGWSNPDPLDAAFRPELVDQHLQQVAERLRRRRMAMMRDPAETGPGHSRRTDAVDALFALPQSLLLIAPRLKRYLQTIFVAGEWAPKPVFLRGIYFTSSLQQGSPLDEALAALRGLSPEEMYRDSSDEREEKTFFLYDLFTEKIFKEKGLITRATNTLTMLSRRRWTLLGAGAAALLLWAGVSSYGYFKLKRSIGYESQLWRTAATNWTLAGTWNPIVSQKTNATGVPGPEWIYNGNALVPDTKRSLVEFHQDLNDFVTKSNNVPWMFWLVSKSTVPNSWREKNAWLVFEKSVVEPLLSAVRSKMSVPATTNQPPPLSVWHAGALISLIKVEKDLQAKKRLDANQATNLLNSLIAYVVETNYVAPPNLVRLLASYVDSDDENDAWLPARLSGGSTLGTNRTIAVGLSQFLTNATIQKEALKKRFGLLEKVWEAASRLRQSEVALYKAVLTGGGGQSESSFKTMVQEKTDLDTALAAAKVGGLLFNGHEFSLQANYARIGEEGRRIADDPLRNIYVAVGAEAAGVGLFREIGSTLDAHKRTFEKEFEIRLGLANTASNLDLQILVALPNGEPAYARRAALYQRAYDFRETRFEVADWVGTGWKQFKGLSTEATGIESGLTNYVGGLGSELRGVCGGFLASGLKQIQERSITQYVDLVTGKLSGLDRTPQSQIDLEFLGRTNHFLKAVETDMSEAKGSAEPALGNQLPKLNALPGRLSAARQSLIQRYARSRNETLTNQLGFPILWDKSDRVLSYGKIRDLKTYLDRLRANELSSTTLTDFPSEPLDSLRANIALLSPVVTAFAGDAKGPPRLTVKIDHRRLKQQKTAFGFYKYWKVSLDGESNGSQLIGSIDVGAEPKMLAKSTLDKPIEIEGRKRADDPVEVPVTFRFPRGLFDWLKESKDPDFDSVNGTWILPQNLPNGTILYFDVAFESGTSLGLPPLSEWPTRSNLK